MATVEGAVRFLMDYPNARPNDPSCKEGVDPPPQCEPSCIIGTANTPSKFENNMSFFPNMLLIQLYLHMLKYNCINNIFVANSSGLKL